MRQKNRFRLQHLKDWQRSEEKGGGIEQKWIALWMLSIACSQCVPLSRRLCLCRGLRLFDSFVHKTFLCAVQSSTNCNKILFACLANAERKRARLRVPWFSKVERRTHSDDLVPQSNRSDRTERRKRRLNEMNGSSEMNSELNSVLYWIREIPPKTEQTINKSDTDAWKRKWRAKSAEKYAQRGINARNSSMCSWKMVEMQSDDGDASSQSNMSVMNLYTLQTNLLR